MLYLNKLTLILTYGIIAFWIALIIYKIYIPFLRKIKAWQSIRENDIWWKKAKIFKQLHQHKKWTPTMWWAVFLVVVALLVAVSVILVYQKNFHIVSYSLLERRETYIILFAFFSMWLLGLVDDILNIRWVNNIKWLTAKMKLTWMVLFSAFISYWMYAKLWIDYINLWPIDWEWKIWFFYYIFTFILTVAIVNAVNITDWLDWLVGWTSIMILWALAVMTFFQKWFLATTIIVIVIATLTAFLRYNISPAKIFMGDSGTLALWGIISTVVYLLWIKFGIWIIFFVLFLFYFIELFSSFLQIFWKKFYKRKLFVIAPFHHYLEYKWLKERSIVMKIWLIQAILTVIWLILFFYQYSLIYY